MCLLSYLKINNHKVLYFFVLTWYNNFVPYALLLPDIVQVLIRSLLNYKFSQLENSYSNKMKNCNEYKYEVKILQMGDKLKGQRPLANQYKERENPFINPNQSYIVKDERGQYIDKRVRGSYVYPNSAIGLIKSKDLFIGTGFLIKQDIVMTCAHNCYDVVKKESREGLQFLIGQRNNRKRYNVERVYYPQKYKDMKDVNKEQKFLYDYAILLLSEKTGLYYGTLGVKFCQTSKISQLAKGKQRKIKISGFPLYYLNNVDKNIEMPSLGETIESKNLQKINKQEDIFEEQGEINELNEALMMMKYKITTTQGQSGSPVFVKEQNQKKQNQYYAIGIHVFGGQQNSGVILNDEKRNNINVWIGKSTGVLDFRWSKDWYSILSNQDFIIISQVRINKPLISDLTMIVKEPVINKLEKLSVLSIENFQFENLVRSIKVFSQLESLNKLFINFEKTHFVDVPDQPETDKIKYLCSFRWNFDDQETILKMIQMIVDKLKGLNKVQFWTKESLQVFPNKIQMLTELQTLDVSQNQITELPEQIGNLINLQYLNLQINQILCLPINIGNLTNLRTLKLSQNMLSQLPKEIDKLVQLESLELSHNNIEQIPNEISNLVNLQTLLLSSNKLSSLPETISKLGKLQILDLSKNRLCKIWLIQSLKTLDLSANQIQQIPIDISKMKSLKKLVLSENMINSIPIQLEFPPDLYFLDLSNNKISIIPLKITHLKSLQTLKISGNEITCFSNKFMKQNKETIFPKLKVLDISNNCMELFDPIIGELIKRSLREVDLSNNKISTLPTNFSSLDLNRVQINLLGNTNLLQANRLSKLFDKEIEKKEKEGEKVQMAQMIKYFQTRIKSQFIYEKYEALRLQNEVNAKQMSRYADKVKQNELNLSGLNQSYLFRSVGALKDLRILNLQGNMIEQLPCELGNLTYLQKLILTENRICRIPEEIENLINLEQINLSFNHLSKLPSQIGKLKNLHMLSIVFNKIKELPMEIGGLTNLRKFHAMFNRLIELPIEVQNLKNLEQLNLGDNQIKKLGKEVGHLHLIKLILNSNQIQSLPQEIGTLKYLQTLDLSYNQIKQLPVQIRNLANLTNFFLQHNKIKKFPEAIENLSKLKELNLRHNQIQELPSYITKMGNLKILS